MRLNRDPRVTGAIGDLHRNPSIMVLLAAGPDGRCRLGDAEPTAQAAQVGRGKSELHRAVCRITSGGRPSRAVYGKCHRKYTASSNRGKGEMVRRAHV